VSVASDGTNRVMTSPDGVTWTNRTAAAANQWYGVVYGNGQYVAVSSSGTNRAMTSPDGVTWTSQATVSGGTWRSVTYGNGLFVAVAIATTGSTRIMTSPDGITWSGPVHISSVWNSITYGNGLFVAVAEGGTDRVMTSPDGVTWTARSASEANLWKAVTYGNGLFVAVSSDGTNRAMTSGKQFERIQIELKPSGSEGDGNGIYSDSDTIPPSTIATVNEYFGFQSITTSGAVLEFDDTGARTSISDPYAGSTITFTTDTLEIISPKIRFTADTLDASAVAEFIGFPTGSGGIDSTTARNTGATGEGVYSHEASNVLNFKKLVAGSGVTLTPADSSITIAATGSASPTVITPSTITSDQDNYSPTNWATATIVRISGDSMIRAITGFASAGIADGHEKKLINVGSYPVYIPGQHPDSQDSNRVNVGYDYMIFPGATCVLVYDNTANRWVITSEFRYNAKTQEYIAAPGSVTAGDWGEFIVPTVFSSGAVGTNVGTNNVFPSGFTLSTSTTASSGAYAGFPKTNAGSGTYGDSHQSIEAYVSLGHLSSGADTFFAAVRFVGGTSTGITNATNSIAIIYSHIYNSGDWSLVSIDNSGNASTFVDLQVAASIDVPILLRLEVDKGLSEARAYVNGTYAGRVTTNLPNSTSTAVNGGQIIIRRDGFDTGGTRTLRMHNLKLNYVFD
jgi:hypothetical protein